MTLYFYSSVYILMHIFSTFYLYNCIRIDVSIIPMVLGIYFYDYTRVSILVYLNALERLIDALLNSVCRGTKLNSLVKSIHYILLY